MYQREKKSPAPEVLESKLNYRTTGNIPTIKIL